MPLLRRQGLSGAISLPALREARTLGHRIGVLGSSPAGYPLHHKLSFEEYCPIRLYKWASRAS